MKDKLNRHGTPLSSEGYVLCGVCQAEVTQISKDTRPQYARCRLHGGLGDKAAEREQKRQEFFERKRQEKKAQS